ncbi:MAG: hypothetical protein ACTSR8_06505 [Promethearchaeota archaeon]
MSRFERTKKEKGRKRETPKPNIKEEKKGKEEQQKTTPRSTTSKPTASKPKAPQPTAPQSTTAKPSPTRSRRRMTRPKPAASKPKAPQPTAPPTVSKSSALESKKIVAATPPTSPKETPSKTMILQPRKSSDTTPKDTSKALIPSSEPPKGGLGTQNIIAKGSQQSSSIASASLSLKAGGILEKLVVDKEEENFYIDKIGAPEKRVPTTPPIIKTDRNGTFNFTINSDQDITFFIEAYKEISSDLGIQGFMPPSQQKTMQTSQSNIELKLLFSTKDSYEGKWTNKKVTLDKKQNFKEFASLLKNKGINFEWSAETTPQLDLQFSQQISMESQEDLAQDKNFSKFQSKVKINLPPLFENPVLLPKTEVIATQPIDLEDEIVPKFTVKSLKNVLKNKLSDVIKLNNGKAVSEEFDSIMAAPKINDSMYNFLKRISLDYVLPGVGNIENNTAFLMTENRRFIEAYMTGLNHEMNRELVWREFPTDKHGTVFTYFWDPVCLEENADGELVPPTDIDELHEWEGNLGKNAESSERNDVNIVIVIKGDVIRRYPDIIVYALKIEGDLLPKTEDQFNAATKIMIQPIFRSQLGPDILAMGFPITKTDLNLDSPNGGNYYFVLQEQQDLPVFGFDLSSSNVETSWEQLIYNQSLRSGYIDDFNDILANNPNSANIAAKTMQLPVRVVIHAKALIEGKTTSD